MEVTQQVNKFIKMKKDFEYRLILAELQGSISAIAEILEDDNERKDTKITYLVGRLRSALQVSEKQTESTNFKN